MLRDGVKNFCFTCADVQFAYSDTTQAQGMIMLTVPSLMEKILVLIKVLPNLLFCGISVLAIDIAESYREIKTEMFLWHKSVRSNVLVVVVPEIVQSLANLTIVQA